MATMTQGEVLAQLLTRRGPVVKVEELHGPHDLTQVYRIELGHAAPDKCAALLAAVGMLDVRDMVMGQYRRSDPMIRLTVRGWVTGEQVALVVCPFEVATEQEAIALIRSHIRAQQVRDLVVQLAQLEASNNKHGRPHAAT